MSELKTLNDIEWIQKDVNDVAIFLAPLREEARKWVEEFENNPMCLPKDITKFFAIFPTSSERLNGAKKILRHFFNLEED